MSNKPSDTTHPSDGGITENISRFSNLLKDSGVAVSLPAVLDTLQGLKLIDICNFVEFKDLLRANLICRQQDLALFDTLFHSFWLGRKSNLQMFPADKSDKHQKGSHPQLYQADDDGNPRSPEADETAASHQGAIGYSPESLQQTGQAKELHFTASPELYAQICKLLQPLNNRLSRRRQFAIRGHQISLKRLLRKNMQFGGELIFLDFVKKKLKKRRVVFFCDVSGSMDVYTLMILQFIHALKQLGRRTEIFFFATDLSRGTSHFEVNDFNSAIGRISDLFDDWGGGTRIGHCLQIFNDRYGLRLPTSKDIVIIFSDGWDRGEIDELDNQMACLKRKAYKIIWLNPLLQTKDYQPICQGMRTALPYVDYFLPMAALQDIRLLTRTLEKMMVE